MPDIQEYERRLGLWIDALESGEFVQGKDYLCHEGAYCCLGVLSEVYRRETGKGSWSPYTDELEELESPICMFVDQGEANDENLVLSVQEWVGLRTGRGNFHGWNEETMGPRPKVMDAFLNMSELSRSLGVPLTLLNDGRPNPDRAPSLTFKEIAAVLRARPRGLFTWTEPEAEEESDG